MSASTKERIIGVLEQFYHPYLATQLYTIAERLEMYDGHIRKLCVELQRDGLIRKIRGPGETCYQLKKPLPPPPKRQRKKR